MAESEMLEETGGGAVKQGAAHAFSASHYFDELTLMKRLEHLSRAHAADLFDLRATDRLAVSDYRKRLEGSGG
jgi:hypothetical protein